MTLTCYIIFGAYLIQLVELLLYPLPSDFSTVRIMQGNSPVKSSINIQFILYIFGTIISILTFLYPGIICLFPGFTVIQHMLYTYSTGWLILLSWCMIIVGSSLTWVAVRRLHSENQNKPDSEVYLVTTGIFSLVRNPITTGLFFILTGFILATPTVEILLGCVVYFLNANARILQEEQQFEAHFGSVYKSYKNRVGRYLPFRALSS